MRDKISSFLILLSLTINAQQGELIEYNVLKNYNKNCDLLPTCIDFISFHNDTIDLSFTTKGYYYKTKPEFSYYIKIDTIEIKYYPPEIIKDTIIFNKENRKYEKVKYYSITAAPFRSAEDKSCLTFLLKFKGVQNIPKCIFYNGGQIANCPTTILEYRIFEGDTINLIDKNGFKDNIWLEFYDTGEIFKRKVYNHGLLIEGYQYDKNGNITHTLSESCYKKTVPK